MRASLIALATTLLASGTARSDELVVYGAGSLREVVSQLAQDFGTAHNITVKAQFGASGRMRERIEAMRHSKSFANEVRRVEGREEVKEEKGSDEALDVELRRPAAGRPAVGRGTASARRSR